MLHACLVLIRQEVGEASYHYLDVLSTLATCLFRQGKFEESEAVMDTAIRLAKALFIDKASKSKEGEEEEAKEKTDEGKHPIIVKLLMTLAQVLCAQQKPVDAHALLQVTERE